ncbi:MAG: protein of unknown function, putative SAM-dependent methyltransferase [Nitrospira sp.]|jgi:hypothetical protein|nr:protein of unknown function, putative SAM-dependent methyltransferase [Nitrospira sp.]
MPRKTLSVMPATRRAIKEIFARLDYEQLGPIYCDEGGEDFWAAKRGLCQRLGLTLANVLVSRLKPDGTSLYVGAGVAEIPLIAMENMDLGRRVMACNLRRREVLILNRACLGLPLRFHHRDAGVVKDRIDHLWLVSVLNDPERFPELSSLSYGRANPAIFDSRRFLSQQRTVAILVDRCLKRLTRPGLVTTTVEEAVWIAEWCHRHDRPYRIERRTFASPTVGDPICLVRVE